MSDIANNNSMTPQEALAHQFAVVSGVGQVRDYWSLLKPRVMSLVVFTGFAGLMAAPGEIHWFLGVIAVFAIALAAGAAGAINMWYERDIDALMARTKNRPLPAGRVNPDEALTFGVVLTVFSILIMALAVNYVAAGLLLAASAFYVFIYTVWLKRLTPYNIVIGGAAGAFPPMIGWAAVTGDVSLASLSLFAIIFIWTPPHFWSLALFRNDDYSKAKVPMLPVVAGEKATRRQILAYTFALIAVSYLPYFLGVVGLLYVGVVSLLGLGFIEGAVRVYREKTGEYKAAKRLFGYSILYLFMLFVFLIIGAVL